VANDIRSDPTNPVQAERLFPKVAVILVNYFGADLTRECVASLVANHYPNLLIIVVDNGSPPADVAQLEQLAGQYPLIQLELMGYNSGFTHANNVGMALALNKHGADFLWVLNNDTEVRADAITTFLRVFQEQQADPADTMLSSIITYADADVVWCNGLRDMAWFNFPRGIDKGRPLPEVVRAGLVLQAAEYCVGCSMFFARELVAKHGMMDEDIFMYFDDLDFSRARTNLHIQQPLVKHKVSATAGFKGSGRFKPIQSFLYAKNGVHYYFRKKKISALEKLIYLTFTNWVFVLLYVRDWPTLVAHLKGLWEGVMNPGKVFKPQ